MVGSSIRRSISPGSDQPLTMFSRRRSASRELAGGSIVLASEGRFRKFVFWVVLFVMLLVAGGLGFRYFEQKYLPDLRVEALENENEALRADVAELREALERAMLDLEIASVTRSELERQLIVLNDSYNQVKKDLEFVKSAGGESGSR